jgi:hypothetical protein
MRIKMRQYSVSKPTYYLWKTDRMDIKELERQEQYWSSLGFRTVVFQDKSLERDIHKGLKEIIKNHMAD